MKQEEYFNKAFGCCRMIYNCMLYDRIEYYKNTGKSLSNTPKEYKDKYQFLKEIDAQALTNEQMCLNIAYKNFFTRRTKGIGFPKFKKKHDKNTFSSFQSLKVNDGKLSICKCKDIKFRAYKDIDFSLMNICHVTIEKSKVGKYYASILVECEEPKKLVHSNFKVGIDLGIKDFAICSDGEVIANPRYTKKYAEKLAVSQRKLSHCRKGSNNYDKARIQVAKVHEKIANSRNDFLHKLSKKLIDENQVIALETLKVKNMLKNHKLAKSISDCSWSTFVSMLEYKAKWYGRTILRVDTHFPSSKTCNCCGYKYDANDFNGVQWNLGIREWSCPRCHNELNRDLNASINILKHALSEGQEEPVDTVNSSSLEQECGTLKGAAASRSRRYTICLFRV